MTKILRTLTIIVAMACGGVAAMAVTADEVTTKAIDRFGKSPSLTAAFTVTVHGHTSSGTITVAGDRFMMDVAGVQTWYDGRSQWTYSPDINEVSLTEPTADELAQINPFAIVSSLRNMFSAKLLSSTAKENVVAYTPRKKGEQGTLTVTYSVSTSWPLKVDVHTGADDVQIVVKSVTVGKTLHPSAFIYDKKLHPGAEIVDLR